LSPAGQKDDKDNAIEVIPGQLSLHGIESPGYIACLAIAENAAGLLHG
jgi:hypothetical protein